MLDRPCPDCGTDTRTTANYGILGPGIIVPPICRCASGLEISGRGMEVAAFLPRGIIFKWSRKSLFKTYRQALAGFRTAEETWAEKVPR